jgi:hypothetical protein
LIPLLLYSFFSQVLTRKVMFFWAIVTPVVLMAMTIIALFVFFLTKISINNYASMLHGFSGFFANLVVLISVSQYFRVKNESPAIPGTGNPTT